MLTREQQISLADISSSSFSWVRTSAIVDWLMSPESFFWIAGKPGSGKSTLMKHLVESAWTLQTLNHDQRKRWKIVSFYFDYRAGKAIANHPLGMVRRFVRQLCNDLELGNKYKLNKLLRGNATVDTYITFLADAVRNMTINICAFVDGLDEYEGDLWELCDVLDRLQNQVGMKMCLASRPEIDFQNFLGNYRSISMQEHNDPSIALYIERKIQRKATQLPSIYDQFTGPLQGAIRGRAEGVILWAKLVVDQMVDSYSETTSTEQLFELLETLPKELESLYDRILGKLNTRFKGEAALIIHMLTEAGGSKEKNVLYSAWSFIQVNVLGLTALKSPLNHRAFDARLGVLLGNMVNTATLTIAGGGRFQILVQLLHKSLSSYLSKTDWVAQNLPPAVKEQYSIDFFWQRLHTDVLSEASKQQAIRPDALEELATKVFLRDPEIHMAHVFPNSSLPFRAHNMQSDLEDSISHHWRLWQDLLAISLNTYPTFTELSGIRDDYRGPETVELCPGLQLASGTSRVLLFHCAFCKHCAAFVYTPWHQARAKSLYERDALNILVDICHRHYDWLLEPSIDRISSLPYQVSRNAFDIILLAPKLLTSKDKHVLELMSMRGTHIESSHLCMAGLSKDVPEIHAAYDQALKYRYGTMPAISHDPDCAYSTTKASPAQHWYDYQLSNQWLDIFRRCGVAITGVTPHSSPKLTEEEQMKAAERLSHRQSGRVYSSDELQQEYGKAPKHTWVSQSPGPAATLALFEEVDEVPGISAAPPQTPPVSTSTLTGSLSTTAPKLRQDVAIRGKQTKQLGTSAAPSKTSMPRKFASRLRALMSID